MVLVESCAIFSVSIKVAGNLPFVPFVCLAFSKDGEFVLCSAFKYSSLAAFVFLIQISLRKVKYTSLVFKEAV